MSNHAEKMPAAKARRWPWVVAIVAALFLGVGIGAASSGDTEPTAADAPEPAPTVTVTAEPSADQSAELDEREAALDEKAAELDEREASITETEEAVAASTVGDGIWTVGVDIEPGTYRASGISSDCYWAIIRTGTNGADIINNGFPGGGNPSVTVDEGHDFESSRCGEWTKQ